MQSRIFKIVRAVDAEEISVEVCTIGPQQWIHYQILLFHNNHSYFSAHRAQMKLSFILNRHLIFALYPAKFHEISFRGRLPFGLVFDLVQNKIAFHK